MSNSPIITAPDYGVGREVPVNRMLVIHIQGPAMSGKFLSSRYMETLNALQSLVNTPEEAYHWTSNDKAKKCAEHISRNECRGLVVEVRAYQPVTRKIISRIF